MLTEAGHEVREFTDRHHDLVDACKWADVVWCDWARSHAQIVAREFTTPLVVRMLGYDVYEPEFRQIDWARVSSLVYACPAHYESACEIEPRVERVRGFQAYCGFDVESWPFHGGARESKRLGFVGWASARKNLWGALQVMRYLPADWRLHVAGECGDLRLRDALARAIEKNGLEEAVVFDGHQENLAEWWRDKAACLVTSLHDQGPLSMVEALACGVRVVATWFPGLEHRLPKECVHPGAIEVADELEWVPPREPLYYRRLAENLCGLPVVGPVWLAAVQHALENRCDTPS